MNTTIVAAAVAAGQAACQHRAALPPSWAGSLAFVARHARPAPYGGPRSARRAFAGPFAPPLLHMAEAASDGGPVLATPGPPDEATRYRIFAAAEERRGGRVTVRFDAADDTSLAPRAPPAKREKAARPAAKQRKRPPPPPSETGAATEDGADRAAGGGASRAGEEEAEPPAGGVPESVLQWEREMRKRRAADRAGKTVVRAEEHLRVVHVDADIVVADKPSGLLCVPGVNKVTSASCVVVGLLARESRGHRSLNTRRLSRDRTIQAPQPAGPGVRGVRGRRAAPRLHDRASPGHGHQRPRRFRADARCHVAAARLLPRADRDRQNVRGVAIGPARGEPVA